MNYEQLLIKQQEQQENDKRNDRRKLLKNSAWILLKQFVYTCLDSSASFVTFWPG